MEHAITINKGMGQTQTLKTLIHEMAHSDLHNNKAREAYAYTYSNQELQAESVAYVVAQHYGIDTSSYSFGYLANWSNENATPLIKKNSHVSTIHRLVEQYNFLSSNGVTSGTQLADLLDRFNNELDATESSLEQLDERLVRQKQVSKALLASQSDDSFEKELAQKLLTSLNIPEHLTYEKSEILAEQIEIETEALRDRYESILDQFDLTVNISKEYREDEKLGDKHTTVK